MNTSPARANAGRLRRYLVRGIAAVAVIAGAGVIGVWGAAEWRLHAQWPAALVPLKAQPSPALVAEGERMFHTFGCFGCHHDAGNVLFEAPQVGRLIAPNISRRAADYSDEELVRLIRRGVKHDGTSALIMPAAELGTIVDEDVAAIVSYIRSLPRREDAIASSTAFGPLGYIAIAAGKVEL